MILSFSQLGSVGRTGNQMFQIAGTIGIATKYCFTPVFPKWEYEKYFTYPLPHGRMQSKSITEKGFKHQLFLDLMESSDLFGWLQTEKYWEHCKEAVLKQFTFTPSVIGLLKLNYKVALSKPNVAIHIRRGDYVNNINYYNLPINYYKKALRKYFEDKDYNVIVFSDDLDYAYSQLGYAPNIFYTNDLGDMESICLMSLCSNWIIANSSFSWWGAYLGSQKGGKVIRPFQHFEGLLKKENDISDLYPSEWICFNHLEN